MANGKARGWRRVFWWTIAIFAALDGAALIQIRLDWREFNRMVPHVEGWGGSVDASQSPPEWLAPAARFTHMEWFASQFGKRYFGVNLSNTGAGDDALPEIVRIPGFNFLTADFSSITDDGLAMLEKADDLITLSLVGTRITDRGIAHLAKLPQLRPVFLDYTDVTDEAVRVLRANPSVQSISMVGTKSRALVPHSFNIGPPDAGRNYTIGKPITVDGAFEITTPGVNVESVFLIFSPSGGLGAVKPKTVNETVFTYSIRHPLIDRGAGCSEYDLVVIAITDGKPDVQYGLGRKTLPVQRSMKAK